MSNFTLFFSTGIQHIISSSAIDHISFVIVLCIRYVFSDWKKLLVLITAFTIGHSLTLALSTLNIINFSTAWCEFLIALTIIITAFNNVTVKEFRFKTKYPPIYFYALVFGLIHGLGFSTMLKSMLGKDQRIVVQLLAFNLGLEVGQLIIVFFVLIISFICLDIIRLKRREYILFVSGGIAALALQMAFERLPVKHKHENEKTGFMRAGGGHDFISACTGYSEQSRLQPRQ